MRAQLKKFNAMAQIMVGMRVGVVLWAVNTYLAAPIFEGNVFGDAMPTWAWIAAHLVFGGALGLIYALWRRGETTLTETAWFPQRS